MARGVCQNSSRAKTRNPSENSRLSSVKSTVLAENVVMPGLLRIHGRDASAYLQGQLSSHVGALAVGATQRSGYHTPQGRVIALLHLARTAEDEFLAELPQELAESVALRLRRHILRSKLEISILDPAAMLLPEGLQASRSRRADVSVGVPQVYAATSEKFVAQMLNLDCIGAIAFDKGCYTGQEVIARAHYRGRVKRRMQRFRLGAAAAEAALAAGHALVPGGAFRLADGRRIEIVDAAGFDDGHIELLAVAPLAATETATAGIAPGGDPDAGGNAAALAMLDATPLPLPYALPG
jgi:folate-binding protein YgfZ